MPAPTFDILAQIEAKPTGNAQTIYTPPPNRVAVIAAVRVVSKWELADARGVYPYSVGDTGRISFNSELNVNDVFPVRDAPKTATGYHVDYTWFATYRVNPLHGRVVYWEATSDDCKQQGSKSVFTLICGNKPVTGLLLSPLNGEHLDIKVPIVTNSSPLTVVNGIFNVNHTDQKLKNYASRAAENHRKRCATLTITVFGQTMDN